MTASGPVSVGGDVTGTAALVVNTPAATTFAGTVTAGSVTTNAPGTTAINGGSVDHDGEPDVRRRRHDRAGHDLRRGGCHVRQVAHGGGETTTVNASGTTTFGGAVTAAAVTTDAPGTTKINGGTVTTTGDQTFGDPSHLGRTRR